MNHWMRKLFTLDLDVKKKLSMQFPTVTITAPKKKKTKQKTAGLQQKEFCALLVSCL